MKRLLYAFLMLLLMPMAGAFACMQNEIDVNGDGALCETAKFTITTTELTADTTFAFYMSARGTFYVDWGDGTVDTITRTDTDETLYDHTYSTAGVKTIRFGGLATEYSTNVNIAAIRFGYDAQADYTTPTLVANIDGSIGNIFLTLGQQADQQPIFRKTFARTGIQSVPTQLFRGITGHAPAMFAYTFYYCTSLTSLPDNLFSGITGAANTMFSHTFMGCSSLVSIPENLFDGISGGASNLFNRTFYGCQSLRYIPPNLFSAINDVGYQMFYRTFDSCTGLSGYIPPSLFAGLINNNSPITTEMFKSTFYNTRLSTSCPTGTTQYITGYEEYWDDHVACELNTYTCNAGYYVPANNDGCAICQENSYCPGGTYTFDKTTASGITQCPNSWYAPAGMSSADQCGRILHIGENVVYLRNVKKTTPSLNVHVDGYTFYGNMTTADVPMNANTAAHMKVEYENETWSIYDDTVTP